MHNYIRIATTLKSLIVVAISGKLELGGNFFSFNILLLVS